MTTKWQRIETAPKNGEWTKLGWFAGHPNHYPLELEKRARWDGNGWLNDEYSGYWTPTHWMPEPPQ